MLPGPNDQLSYLLKKDTTTFSLVFTMKYEGNFYNTLSLIIIWSGYGYQRCESFL